MIIYFSIELKRRILKQFFKMLNPGGALLMGSSESIYNLSEDFDIIKEGKSTYYRPKKD